MKHAEGENQKDSKVTDAFVFRGRNKARGSIIVTGHCTRWGKISERSRFPSMTPHIDRNNPGACNNDANQRLMRIFHDQFSVLADKVTDVGEYRNPDACSE